MQPPEVLATYIYIQCRRNQAKPGINATLDPIFIQQAQQSCNDLKLLITKVCDKLRLLPKQVYQCIRLLEKYCKNKDVSLVFNNYYRLTITCVNVLNKYYNDKYLWLHSMQQLTGIPSDVIQQGEVNFCSAIDFELNYPEQLYQSDVQKLQLFIEKYSAKYCK